MRRSAHFITTILTAGTLTASGLTLAQDRADWPDSLAPI